MSLKPRDKEVSPSSRVHETCQLLENSLSALVADAAVLGQLSALQDEIPNNPDLGKQLLRIERVVSELEDKMQLFRDVVKEEQKAIADIEASAATAESKVAEFQALLALLPPESPFHGEQQEELNASADRTDEYDDDSRHDSYDDKNAYKDIQQHFIKLEFVSQDEFLRVPRATRAHISRALVNEAVLDIERAFQEKETLRLKTNRRKRAMYKWNKGSNEEESLTCSEQEMRQSCAFFRSGESSARGVLMILRHLNRIKQIPSGNGQIVYALV